MMRCSISKKYALEVTDYIGQLKKQAITISSLEEGVTGPFSKLGLVTTYQYPHASAPDQEPKSLDSLNGVYSKRNVRGFHTKSVYCQFCDKEAVLRIRKHGDPNATPPYLRCDNVEATPKIWEGHYMIHNLCWWQRQLSLGSQLFLKMVTSMSHCGFHLQAGAIPHL